MLKAQEVKQNKGLTALEKRLQKAQIKANQESIDRILAIQNEVFPNQSLLERKTNFSDYYHTFSAVFIEKLLSQLDPLHMKFTSLFLD
jgi:hypothetical protein